MKSPTTNRRKPNAAGLKEANNGSATAQRGWGISLGLAVVLVGIGIGLSAVINPLFGRYVHWDWMTFLARPLGMTRLTGRLFLPSIAPPSRPSPICGRRNSCTAWGASELDTLLPIRKGRNSLLPLK
jgi:hypothetical protein